MTETIILTLATFCASWALSGLVRRHALTHGVLDLPNERSSHVLPTPRGGGAAIVLTLLSAAGFLVLRDQIPIKTFIALLGVIPVAVVGWMDDRRSVPAFPRVVLHLASAAWAVAWLGGLPSLTIGSSEVRLGTAGGLIATIGVVWSINLFNFMDGIDGISGVEAATLAGAGSLMLNLVGATGLTSLALATAGAALGFLYWNWPPARLFMGDVGSGALGFWFAVLAIASERSAAVPVLVWGLLAGVFIVDATATLLRRVVNAEPWYQPHRSHAYQRLSRTALGHTGVSAGVLAVNTVLAGLAFASLVRPSARAWLVAGGFAGLCCAYVVVVRRYPADSGLPPTAPR